MKNILYIEGNTDGTIGGSYFSLYFLASGIDRRKYTPFVGFYFDHSMIPMFNDAGLQTTIFKRPDPIILYRRKDRGGLDLKYLLLPLQKTLNLFMQTIWMGYKNLKFIQRNNIDLVHLNNSITRNHDWILASLFSRAVFITHERGINDTYSVTSRLFSRRLKKIICISKAVENALFTAGIKKSKLELIYNGLDPAQLAINKTKEDIFKLFDIADNSRVIGMIGNIKEWKGQEVVLKAVNLLKTTFPEIKCLFIGDTSPEDKYYEARLQAIIQSDNLDNHIIFTGYQRNIANIVNALEVVIHASISPEPFGRVLIEAMALQKPLIGSNGGAVPEIIEDGVTGYVFEPGNHLQLASYIERLLNDPKLQNDMGLAGIERLNKHFHIRSNINTTEKIYQSLLE